MKLKYTYSVETGAEDQGYSATQGLRLLLDSCEVELLFDENHYVSAIAVYITNVELPRKAGRFDLSSFPEETAKAYAVASFLINLFYYQTGKGVLLEAPNGPQSFLSDTNEEAEFLRGLVVVDYNIPVCWGIAKEQYDVSATTLQRYLRVKDPLAIYADACRLTDPISRFRELYRVLEHLLPLKGSAFDEAGSQHLAKFDPQITTVKIRALRRLRHKCSHSKKDFITSGDWEGLNQVREALRELQEIARVLLEHPPFEKNS